MEFIKPKFNIGDKIYYIYPYQKYKNAYCESCKLTHRERDEVEWKYYNQDLYISSIKANFNDNTISYNLSSLCGDEFYQEWDTYCEGIMESDIFLTLEEASEEVNIKNNKSA
jgi:hypothetical protein